MYTRKLRWHTTAYRFLTTSELRLGRQSIEEIRTHAFFDDVTWDNLHNGQLLRPRKIIADNIFLEMKPDSLHLPQFTYAAPMAADSQPDILAKSRGPEDSNSAPFAFSALFQSPSVTSQPFSVLHQTPSQKSSRSILRERPAASFIGFSWGPSIDAFKDTEKGSPLRPTLGTPRVLQHAFTPLRTRVSSLQATPQQFPFATPIRPSSTTPFQTLPRASTVRRTAPRRTVSDREAMKQLVNCVGMSARKKVLESGRKPRILTSASRSRSSTLKELRFDRSVMVFNGDSGGISYRMDPTTTTTSESAGGASFSIMSASVSSSSGLRDRDHQSPVASDTDSSMDSAIMYSPSPSPRPGSALSGIISRRSQTPTLAGNGGSYVLKVGPANMPTMDSRTSLSPSLVADPQWPENEPEKPMLTDVPLKQSQSLSFKALDDLERRHARLMSDIAGIGARLGEISVSAGASGRV